MDDEDKVIVNKPKKRRGRGRPWQKGQSGNPAGRPPHYKSITERLRELMEAPLEDGRTLADNFARLFLAQASQGKFPWAKEIIDRVDGKVPERISIDCNRLTNEQLERIAGGEDPAAVLATSSDSSS